MSVDDRDSGNVPPGQPACAYAKNLNEHVDS